MKKIINRGFTLIELLVVIAIIGILASIVLVSLNSARSKGKDTRIISDVKEVQTQIEAEATAGGTYQAGGGSGTTLCIKTTGASAGSAVSAYSGTNCPLLTADAASNGGTFTVRTNAANASATTFQHYSVSSTLASNSAQAFCADDTGKVEQVAASTITSNVCP